jgi:hypothetical protein
MESTGHQSRAIEFLCAPTSDNLGGNFKRLPLLAARRLSRRSHFDSSRLADTFETEGHSGAWWLSAAGGLPGRSQRETAFNLSHIAAAESRASVQRARERRPDGAPRSA